MLELDFKKSGGLIPAIAQDYKTGDVLMLAYINEQSWNETLKSGVATYWSRSRNKLWKKGEESGNTQVIKDILVDCDEDTVIFHLALENLTDEEIAYDKYSFSAQAGGSIYYMSVSDASGLMPPKSKTHVWFGITSTAEGGRNNLKADNDWLLALTTREAHLDQLQSVAAQKAKVQEKPDEMSGIRQTVEILHKMREETRKSVRAMKERGQRK